MTFLKAVKLPFSKLPRVAQAAQITEPLKLFASVPPRGSPMDSSDEPYELFTMSPTHLCSISSDRRTLQAFRRASCLRGPDGPDSPNPISFFCECRAAPCLTCPDRRTLDAFGARPAPNRRTEATSPNHSSLFAHILPADAQIVHISEPCKLFAPVR